MVNGLHGKDLMDDGKVNDSFKKWIQNGDCEGTGMQSRCIEAILIHHT